MTKVNLTYHSSSSRGDGGGDSAAFRYYRYRIAAKTVDTDVMHFFELRYKKVRDAKKEIEYFTIIGNDQNNLKFDNLELFNKSKTFSVVLMSSI